MKRHLTRPQLLGLAAILWMGLVLCGVMVSRWEGWPIATVPVRMAIFFTLAGWCMLFAVDAVISRRIRALTETIREKRAMADFKTRIDRISGAEFLDITSEINGLLSALDATHEDLRQKHADLEKKMAESGAELAASRQALAEHIARQIQTERESAEHERFYRTLLELAPIGIVLESEDGVILDVNQALCNITGYTREELIGQPIFMLADADRHDSIRSNIACLLDGATLVHEVENRRKDGSRCQIELRECAITLPDGTRRILVTASDITDRKRAEKRLHDSEARYRQLFNTSIAGFALHEMIFDEKGNPVDYIFLDINPAFTAMTGKRRDEVIGRRVTEVFPGVEEEWIIRYGEVAKTGKPAAFERYAAPLQKYFSVIAFSPQPGQFAVNFIDVTEQRRASDLIRLQSAALETAANAIMIVDRTGNITWVNKAFTTLTGYALDEVVGKKPSILKSGRQKPAVYADLWRTVLAGESWHGELINQRKDGSIYLEDQTITPVLGEDGAPTHFVAIKQDITERRALERRLFESQKMETIGRLAGGIAHDFNNLLQAITGFSHLLLESMDARNPNRDDVMEIAKAARRASDLTRQLLAFSRKQLIEPRTLDLNSLVMGTQKMLNRLIGEDVRLVLELDPNLDPVRVDPGQIEQVLINLALNARDAMPNGGRLTISTRSVVLLKEDVIFDAEKRHGRFVVLDVTDNGLGMTPEIRDRIFEPFFTTKGPGRGTGLGLAVVYGIIQQHEGMIHVYSELGRGSTFRIYLPVSNDASAQIKPDDTSRDASDLPRGKNERILLVEDESGVRDFAFAALRKYGYQPILADSAATAIRVFEEYEGHIDLLFTDVVLPDRTGLELAEMLRTKYPGLRLLLTSGYMDEKSRWPIICERNYPFLQKPYPLDSLLKTVRQVLDQPAPAA